MEQPNNHFKYYIPDYQERGNRVTITKAAYD